MKSIRVHATGEPEVMRLEDVPDPKPGPGQVVLAVRAIGVNPVETYVRSGKYPVTSPLPYTPGTDCAGVIEAVGDGVTRFKPGDRAYAAATVSGAYAENALCAERSVYPLPERATFEQGAALGVPYATAHRALFHRGGAKAGETVLVHGASGGVGTAATQWARAAGLTVLGTAGTPAGLQLARDSGAHEVFDHHDPNYLQAISKATGGRGVEIILEMLANVNLAKDLPLLAKYGRVVVVGNRGTVEINPRDLMGRDADIRGMTLMNCTEPELAAIHAAIRAGLENGAVRPVVGKRIPLAEAPRAHRELLDGKSQGKMILVP